MRGQVGVRAPLAGLAEGVDTVVTIERSSGNPSLERDVFVLRDLAGHFLPDLHSAQERSEVLHRTALRWPSEPSPLLRLAAVAHGLDEGLDERFAGAAQQLAAWAARDPWSVEPGEVETLRLATLVCLEPLEYASFVPNYETPMVLRDALSDPEDLSTIAAMVRWESLERREVTTPDRLLLSWRGRVSSVAREGHRSDPSEYCDTLDHRGHLQRFVAALSWPGQAQWRELIEPVDEAFRACTERQDVPLALTGDAKAGGWWRYRLPVGAAASPGWAIWPVEPKHYVTGRHGGGLRTISHVWELAERPWGVRAMTDQELDRWGRLCAFQADAMARHHGASTGWWPDQHERVKEEQLRRTADDGEPR